MNPPPASLALKYLGGVQGGSAPRMDRTAEGRSETSFLVADRRSFDRQTIAARRDIELKSDELRRALLESFSHGIANTPFETVVHRIQFGVLHIWL